jgi:hypothetical protein
VDGAGAAFVTRRGITFAATPPAGQSDVIRVGTGEGRTTGGACYLGKERTLTGLRSSFKVFNHLSRLED